MPTPIRDAIHAMNTAGISKSQIEFHPDAADFISSASTIAAATAGLARLAEIAKRAAPDAKVFLRTFVDKYSRSARKAVKRFSSGIMNKKEIRLFFQSLRRYKRVAGK